MIENAESDTARFTFNENLCLCHKILKVAYILPNDMCLVSSVRQSHIPCVRLYASRHPRPGLCAAYTHNQITIGIQNVNQDELRYHRNVACVVCPFAFSASLLFSRIKKSAKGPIEFE